MPRRWLACVVFAASACGAGPSGYGGAAVSSKPEPEPVVTLSARTERTLSARIAERQTLLYEGGADEATGRPAHVRAGSALVWLDENLAVVQDDALFLALIEPRTARVTATALPAGAGGARLFDDTLGNKAHKLDLEAALVLGGRLYAFGSGSTDARELVVSVRLGDAPVAEVMPAHGLYRALRERTDFSGSELNIEGAALLGDDVVLVQRGNGRERDGMKPVNASVRLDARALIAYLKSGDRATPPPLGAITRFELGSIAGVGLSFTDVAARGDRLFYLAAAENSPDTVQDGVVVGTELGVIEPDGRVRSATLLAEDGAPFTGKAEGLALGPDDPTRAFVVLDPDDPAVPTELCRLELSGF